MNLPNNEIFVDPGIDTGIALFKGDISPEVMEINYLAKENKSIENFLFYMSIKFSNFIEGLLCYIKKITIERPEFWSNSLKSEVSLSSDGLFKLALLTGVYSNVCVSLGITFRLIKAKEWKGQLTKEATIARVKRINGIIYKSTHITDAVGMGFAQCREVWSLKYLKGDV